MKKMSILALSLVLVGAGCAGAATQEVVEVTMEEERMELEDGFYQLDLDDSSIAWKASNLKLKQNGIVRAKEGSVRVENNLIGEGSILIDMTTVTNLNIGNDSLRDSFEAHMKSGDFFDVSQFPTAAFALITAEELNGMKGSNYRVDGELTIKNVVKSVSFPAWIEQGDEGLRMTGELVIDRSEFGVKYGSGSFFDNLGDNLIHDEFILVLDLMFKEKVESDKVTEGAS